MKQVYYFLLTTSYLLLGICCQNPSPETAPSWLPGFAYRIPIVIQEKSGMRLKDYQVRIEIQGQDPNKPWCVDFSRIKPDGPDIRFTDAKHHLINFWIQEWDNITKTACIWIKVPCLEASVDTTIYLYYGNPLARSLSSFENTMQKFTVDESTAAVWHFDESDNKVLDNSPHNNHSDFYRAHWRQENIGPMPFPNNKVLTFDGKTEHIRIPYHKSLDFTEEDKLSIEAWVNPTSFSTYSPIICKRGQYILSLMTEGKATCYLWGPKPETYYISKNPLPLNTWTYLAVTYDGEFLRFYLNSELDSEVPLTGVIQPALDRIHNIDYRTAPLYIGHDAHPSRYSSGRFWCGNLDEIRILKRVLSAGEIRCNYESRAYAPIEPVIILGEEEKLQPQITQISQINSIRRPRKQSRQGGIVFLVSL